MGWSITQFKQDRKEPRHARVRLDIVECADCGRELPRTHQIIEFGGRCRPCWKLLVLHLPGGVNIQIDHYAEG